MCVVLVGCVKGVLMCGCKASAAGQAVAGRSKDVIRRQLTWIVFHIAVLTFSWKSVKE